MQKPRLAAYIIVFDGKMRTLTPINATVPRQVAFTSVSNSKEPASYWCVLIFLNSIPLIPACTARPGLPLSPPEIAFLESPYYRPQTASIADRHHPTNFHSVTYTQSDDAAFEAGSDNDHKSFLRMRVIFKVEYPAELFRFRRVLDDILSSFDVF